MADNDDSSRTLSEDDMNDDEDDDDDVSTEEEEDLMTTIEKFPKKTLLIATKKKTLIKSGKPTVVKKRKRRKQKPKDYPKRPLSSYNVFFKETRETILEEQGKTNFQDMVSMSTHVFMYISMASSIYIIYMQFASNTAHRFEKLLLFGRR
jgi:hypothetical protein